MGVETLNRAKRVCIRESVPPRSDGNKPLGFFSNYALARKSNKTICNSCKNERERVCVCRLTLIHIFIIFQDRVTFEDK